MTANNTKSWLEKWWLWILLGLAATIYILSRVLPTSKGKPDILRKAKNEAEEIKVRAGEKLKAHVEIMQERRRELEHIKAILDEEKRLNMLADFANKRNSK